MKPRRSALCIALVVSAIWLVPTRRAEAGATDPALCKEYAGYCAVAATGTLLICAAAAYEAGANVIANAGCKTLFRQSTPVCVAAAAYCVDDSKSQPRIFPKSIIGRTTSGSGTTSTTINCPGSHRAVGFRHWRDSNNRTTRFGITCSNGTTVTAGGSFPSDTSASMQCGAGKLVQGASGGIYNDYFYQHKVYCDDVTAISDVAKTMWQLPAGGGSTQRMCDEKSYIVGAVVFHASARLKGVEYLCQALPGTP